MKILMLSPLWFRVARDSHGGIETSLSALVRALEKLGAEVTVAASADSNLDAGEILPIVPRNIFDEMKDEVASEYVYFEQHLLAVAIARADGFDLIHSHIGPSAYFLSGLPGMSDRTLHTQHTPATQDLRWFVGRHPELWIAAVSRFQAEKLQTAGAQHCRVIPNGIEVGNFTFQPSAGDDFVYIGRMEWAKGPDLAIEIARRLGRDIKLAGPIVDQAFFESSIRPQLGAGVEYLGIVEHEEKNSLLGGSACALMPSRWDEPFGLVAIEAMACGTPVAALASGALPEIIEPGVTGGLASREEDLLEIVNDACELDRRRIRVQVEARFDIATMASSYFELFEEMLGSVQPSRRGTGVMDG